MCLHSEYAVFAKISCCKEGLCIEMSLISWKFMISLLKNILALYIAYVVQICYVSGRNNVIYVVCYCNKIFLLYMWSIV